MPPTRTASHDGAGPHNLFAEPAEHVPPARPRNDGRARRGRGLVIAVDDDPQTRRGASQFTRQRRGGAVLPAFGRDRAERANTNARRLLAKIASAPYGALIAFVTAGLMLLALSWLALSLRAAESDRARLRDQRDTAVRAVADQRARTTALTVDRARAQRATRAAQTGALSARRWARSWQMRARRAEHNLAATRTSGNHHHHR